MLCSNVTFDKDLSVLRKIIDGILLLFFVKEHCLAKKEFNNSAFSLKSVINPLLRKNGRIHGIFLIQERFNDWPVCFRTGRSVYRFSDTRQ